MRTGAHAAKLLPLRRRSDAWHRICGQEHMQQNCYHCVDEAMLGTGYADRSTCSKIVTIASTKRCLAQDMRTGAHAAKLLPLRRRSDAWHRTCGQEHMQQNY